MCTRWVCPYTTAEITTHAKSIIMANDMTHSASIYTCMSRQRNTSSLTEKGFIHMQTCMQQSLTLHSYQHCLYPAVCLKFGSCNSVVVESGLACITTRYGPECKS